MYALSFGCVTINGTVSWTALFLWRQVMWKEKSTRGVNILFILLYQINFRNVLLASYYISDCSICSDEISRHLKFIWFSKRRYNQYKWVNCVAMEKVVLILNFQHFWWFCLFSYGLISLKSSNAFLSSISNEI